MSKIMLVEKSAKVIEDISFNVQIALSSAYDAIDNLQRFTSNELNMYSKQHPAFISLLHQTISVLEKSGSGESDIFKNCIKLH